MTEEPPGRRTHRLPPALYFPMFVRLGEALLSAQSLSAVVWSSAALVGPALGGLLLATTGAAAVLAINGLSALAALIAFVPLSRARLRGITRNAAPTGLTSGLSAIAQSGLAGVAAACMALTAASFGARTIVIAVAAGAALVSLLSGRRASERQSHPAS